MVRVAVLMICLLVAPAPGQAQDYGPPPVGLQVIYSNGVIETVVAVEGEIITTTWAQPTGQFGSEVINHYVDRIRTWRGLLIDRVEGLVTEIGYDDRYQTVTDPRRPAELFPLAPGKRLDYQVTVRDNDSRKIYQEIDGQITVGEQEVLEVGLEEIPVWVITDRFTQYPSEGEVIDNEIIYRYAPSLGLPLAAEIFMNGYPLEGENYVAYHILRPEG